VALAVRHSSRNEAVTSTSSVSHSGIRNDDSRPQSSLSYPVSESAARLASVSSPVAASTSRMASGTISTNDSYFHSVRWR